MRAFGGLFVIEKARFVWVDSVYCVEAIVCCLLCRSYCMIR